MKISVFYGIIKAKKTLDFYMDIIMIALGDSSLLYMITLGGEMSKEKAFTKLADHLSTGFLADNVMIILNRFAQGKGLSDRQEKLLAAIRDAFLFVSQFSGQDPFSIAIRDPLKSAENYHTYGQSLMPDFQFAHIEKAKELGEILKRVLNNDADVDIKPLREHFARISRNSLRKTEELIRGTEELGYSHM